MSSAVQTPAPATADDTRARDVCSCAAASACHSTAHIIDAAVIERVACAHAARKMEELVFHHMHSAALLHGARAFDFSECWFRMWNVSKADTVACLEARGFAVKHGSANNGFVAMTRDTNVVPANVYRMPQPPKDERDHHR